MLSLGIGGLQMMLDRGQDQDWFTSREIIVEAVLGGLGVYLFIVHMMTAKKPFIPPAIFRDRNFSAGLVMMFATGTILVSSSSLMAPWLQDLANYPVETAGLIMAPRGIGTMVAMMIGGRLSATDRSAQADGVRHPAAVLVDVGDDVLDAGRIAQWRIVVTIIVVQGAGLGFVFIPLQVLAFATLGPAVPHRRRVAVQPVPQYRRGDRRVGDVRSMLAHNTQALHAEIGASVTPFNRALQAGGAVGALLGSGHAPRRGGAGSDDQPAGADHRLYRRLPDDDLHHRAVAAAAVADAPAGWRVRQG